MSNIKLQKLTQEHASDKYVGWLNDKEINQYLESRYVVHTIESVKQYIISMSESNTEYLFGIFCDKTDAHIGNIKLGPVDFKHSRAEIGLLIGDKNYWGKGIATSAIRLISKYAQEQLNIHKVEAGCYFHNIGSLKAFQKAGFEVEGLLKDHAFFEDDWVHCYRLGLVLTNREGATS